MLNAGICFNIQNNNWQTVSSYNIKDAKNIIKESKVDLILLDVNLPDGNGFEFSKIIKEKFNIPFVFLTAHNLDDEVLKGLELGADDYITKPFNIKILLKKIELILNRNSSEISEFSIKDLVINFEARTVKKAGRIIYLTPTEFDLLQVFVKNKSMVLTRQILLEKLWDCKENFVDEHTLTLNISRLRSKLDRENDKYIKTIYGIGYKLVEE
ncbi:response regulator transcription factor [Duncaniella muris]|uniref:response regulator transcription factor n=1 Tax=Duncaniella muris TaxID=2094150 RepID=UPI00272B6B79|nr:response regulator transcription factor [Duncaniella muris]